MKSNSMTIPILRPDFQYILDLIPTGFRVLDLGCGDGDLLYLLKKKGVRGQGIEKNEDCIYKCIERGVIVHHGDLDEGLKHHIKKSFDYVILNQTIQETHNPGNIIKDSLRIGKKKNYYDKKIRVAGFKRRYPRNRSGLYNYRHEACYFSFSRSDDFRTSYGINVCCSRYLFCRQIRSIRYCHSRNQ
ncbi:MAG: methyltransferase domain-containing protein [Leptospiraceae bacterium]|nr:methyltransferase domain-containing protein [Leptospiraceae bacterium]